MSSNDLASRLGLDLSELPSIITERLRGRSEDPEKRLKIGRYLVLGELGQGGMGLVYESWDPHIERFVAIKTVEPDLVPDPQIREETIRRFLRETKIVGRLRHPGIITIFDYGHEPENLTKVELYRPGCVYYYVMELLDGQPLGSRLNRNGNLSDRDAVAIARDVADALTVAHDNGVIHRDVKPSNIFIRDSGQAVLLDFGIAKTASAGLTRQGQILGTPSYLAPERLQEKTREIDARADQFSLGVLLYTMLTGKRPFVGDSLSEVLEKIQNKSHQRIERESSAGRALSKLIDRLLAKEAKERYETVKPVVKALNEILVHLPPDLDSESNNIVTPAAVPVHMPMEQIATEVATPRSPEAAVRVGELMRQEGTRPDAALQRQTRQIKIYPENANIENAGDLQNVTVKHPAYDELKEDRQATVVSPPPSIPKEDIRSGPVPSSRFGSVSEDETVAEGEQKPTVEQVELQVGIVGETTAGRRSERVPIEASGANEADVILSPNGVEPEPESVDTVVHPDQFSDQKTEQVRARAHAPAATEIVRARKKKNPIRDIASVNARQGRSDPAEGFAPQPSAAVARRTIGVGKDAPSARTRQVKTVPLPEIQIRSNNLGRPLANQRKLQNRVAILLGAVLCAVAIGLLLGQKRQRSSADVDAKVETQLAHPTAKRSESTPVKPVAKKPRLVVPRTASSLLRDADRALQQGKYSEAKTLYVRAREASGTEERSLQLAGLGEIRSSIKLGEAKNAMVLLRDLEARGADPVIIEQARKVFPLKNSNPKRGTGRKKIKRVKRLASCKEIALKYLSYPKEGVKALESLATVSPKNSCVQKQLGAFYARLNEPRKALSSYERYLGLSPNAPDKKAVKSKIRGLKRLLGR